MKVTFHYKNGTAEVFLVPENKRDDSHLELLRSCEDMAIIGTSPNDRSLAILFKERKLET